ncbi:cobalamin B12-binding domain-containing protein [Chloroflexota bacterium]
MDKKIRILLAKIGLDGHDRGVLMVAHALRDAGMEVIYTGLHTSPEQVAVIAMQEDVDIIGISSLVDAHRTFVPWVFDELKKKELDIPVIVGGFIQPEDYAELKEQGVTEVFAINSRLGDITNRINALALKIGRRE